MTRPVYRPGDKLTISGIPCTVFAANELPQPWVDHIKKIVATYRSPLKRISLWALSMLEHGAWEYHCTPPDSIGPSMYANGDAFIGDVNYITYVPDIFIKTKNEWGEIAP